MGVHCPLCEEPFQGALAGTYFQPSLLHGIWSAGRPDKFYFSSTQKLQAGKTIQIFNYGNCKRDFTYVDDIVEGILRVMQGPPGKQTGEDGLPLPPYAVCNIGGGAPETFSTISPHCRKSWFVPAFCQKIMILKATDSLSACSLATCQSHMRTAPVSRKIMASHRRSGSARA